MEIAGPESAQRELYIIEKWREPHLIRAFLSDYEYEYGSDLRPKTYILNHIMSP